MSPTPTDPAKAQVWITGQAPNLEMEVYVPAGPTGVRGPQGDLGPVGPPPTLTVVDTVTGPETPGAQGAQGVKGDRGDPGGWVASTDLGAANLNTIVTPGLYRQNNSANSTAANNYPVDGALGTGVLEVIQQAAATTYTMQRYSPFGTSVRAFYMRWQSNGTWTPWRAYNATRVDQTAGRAIYAWDDLNSREQLIYGDTGWRRVVNDADIPTQPNLQGYIRRVNSRVTFVTVEHTGGGATTTATTLYNIPLGFRANSGQSNPAMIFSGSVVDEGAIPVPSTSIYAITAGANTIVLKPASGKRHYAVLSYDTNDPWPTTLPGATIGSIPNA